MNYGNLLVSSTELYFIDFEFSYSGSRYHDIGHFFRRKDDNLQAYVTDEIKRAFKSGYDSCSDIPLPEGWLLLARLCDINAMLCLLNYDKVPEHRVSEIEHGILQAVNGGAL